MSAELALSNFSEFIDDEEDKELLLHIVDHLEKGKDRGCRGSRMSIKDFLVHCRILFMTTTMV